MICMNAKQILTNLKNKYEFEITEVKRDICKKGKTTNYWIDLNKAKLHDFVEDLCKMEFPFLPVISGRDNGKNIILIYHFFVNSNGNDEGINVNVKLPLKNPKIDTITDLIPGAMLSELEKQEMLGVNVKGIKDEYAFLPISHKKGFYPWRRKELGRE